PLILSLLLSVCFFTDTPTTEIYTLSLHDALPILDHPLRPDVLPCRRRKTAPHDQPFFLQLIEMLAIRPFSDKVAIRHDHDRGKRDRKSTRLNSSHVKISYAVFCLKKKKTKIQRQ